MWIFENVPEDQHKSRTTGQSGLFQTLSRSRMIRSFLIEVLESVTQKLWLKTTRVKKEELSHLLLLAE